MCALSITFFPSLLLITMLCVLTGDAVSPESKTEWSPYLVTVHFSETDIDG